MVQIERLLKAAARGRHGHRDATMILLAYRLGCASASSSRFKDFWQQEN